MNKQTVLWTALPFGVRNSASGPALVLSVALAPRLWSDDLAVRFLTLDQFPDWLDLPAMLRDATFTLEFDNGLQLPATRTSLDPALPDELDSTLWRALFDARTLVLPFRYTDFSTRPVQSYSARALDEFVRNLYTRAGAQSQFGAGAEYPSLAALGHDDALRAIESPAHRDARRARQERERQAAQDDRDAHAAELGRRKNDFVDWQRGRDRRSDDEQHGLEHEQQDREPGESSPLPSGRHAYEPTRPPFQDLDASDLQHPTPPALPEDAPFTAPMNEWARQFNAFRALHEPRSANVLPRTQAEFVTRLENGSITDAELAQLLDFHRAVALVADYPRLLRRLGLVVDLSVPRTAQIPATGDVRVLANWKPILPTLNDSLRTRYTLDAARFVAAPAGGELSRGMIHLANADYVKAQLDVDGAAFKLSNLAGDLQDALTNLEAAPTSSLPALRSGGLALLQSKPAEALAAKFKQSKELNDLVDAQQAALASATGAMQNPRDPQGRDIITAETLVRGYRVDVFDESRGKWLSLHRRVGNYVFTRAVPGLTLELEDEGSARLSATTAADGTRPDLLVHEALAVWQGWSLAAPQPGKAIANPDERGEGNRIPTQDKPPLQDSNANPASSALGLETTFVAKPGALPRLRFGHTYRLRVRAADLAGNSPPLETDAAQAALPEATPPTVYRRFEPVSEPFLAPRKTFEASAGESLERLVIRTQATPSPAGTGGDGTSDRHVLPPRTAQHTAELHGVFDGPVRLKNDQAGYDLARREAAPFEAVHPEDNLAVPYLPDPLARGAVLLGLPGMGPTEITPDLNKLAFTGAYPDLKAFRLILQAGNAPPRWDAEARTLTVSLPPGDTARLRLSSFVNAVDLALLGVWEWISAGQPPNLAALEQLAQNGRHWMLTPYRTLTLVHAVSRPLTAPAFTRLEGNRIAIGRTRAALTGALALDRKSTAHVDLVAEWSDPLDDPADDANDPSRDATSYRMPAGAVPVPFADGPVADLGVLQPSTAPVPVDLNYEFPDTKYHRVTYRATATTRFRDYFATEAQQGIELTREMADVDARALDISSSARPDAPQIAYIVPTFRWELHDPGVAEHAFRRNRAGGGLRVYLERPWFSSGAGELLGVVFMKSRRFEDLSPQARACVTQWGIDPVLFNQPVPEAVEYDHWDGYVYPTRTDPARTWSLDELDQEVSVAAFPVQYDSEHKLWFSDLDLILDQVYFPFVRLALVRCQPHALPGVELSRVALADFMQIAPDRNLTITQAFPSGGMTQLFVTLDGDSYQSGATRPEREIHIDVQTPNPELGGDLGWENVNGVEVNTNQSHSSLWQGTVRYPFGVDPARLVITETEQLSPQSRRVIYADIAPVMVKPV